MYKSHEIANIWPKMSEEDYQRLKASIEDEGLLEPIWLYNDQVLDGRHRYRACRALGVEPEFRQYDGDDPMGFAFALNSARRHLTTEQKAALAVSMKMYEAKRARERQSTSTGGTNPQLVENFPEAEEGRARDIAGEKVGVSGRSVDKAWNASGVVERKGAGGEVEYEVTKPDVFERLQRGEYGSVSTAEKVGSLEPEEREAVHQEMEKGTPARKALESVKHVHVSANSGNNEWYTPSEYIEAAREVMGGIDLDPASCAVAQERVNADVFYTAEDDGLGHEWAGRVWMNPPYAKGLVDEFAEKLDGHVRRGDVSAAVVLVNNATDTRWFATLVNSSSAVCFPTGRVKFHRPDGSTGAPLQGQAIIYFGPQVGEFQRTFSQFGHVWERL